MIRITRVLLLLFLFQSFGYSQHSKLFINVDSISQYIISDGFQSLYSSHSDIELIDSIYLFALKLNKNDISETLLSLTFATLPFDNVPITTPFIGLKINYPLLSPKQKLFSQKVEKMPKTFFFDSPKTEFGDKDKLAHFFGNAFIAYNLNFLELTSIIGYFVEVFEETFRVSKIDVRDIRANHLGEIFGKQLLKDRNALPSKLFIMYNLQNIRIRI